MTAEMKMINISITDSKKAIRLILNSDKLTSEVKILFPNKVLVSTKDLKKLKVVLKRNYISFSC